VCGTVEPPTIFPSTSATGPMDETPCVQGGSVFERAWPVAAATSMSTSSAAATTQSPIRSRWRRIRPAPLCRTPGRNRCSSDDRVGHRIRAVANRERGRFDGVANTYFVSDPVEGDRRAVEECSGAPKEPRSAGGVSERDTNFHHQVLPARSVVADRGLEVGQIQLQPASLWEDFLRRRLLRAAQRFAAPIAKAPQPQA
jgi:hypothetical protein